MQEHPCGHSSVTSQTRRLRGTLTIWKHRYIHTCILAVALDRSSSEDSAMRYVLPALGITPCFHIMGTTGQNQARRKMFPRVRQVAVLGTKLLSTIDGCLVRILTLRQDQARPMGGGILRIFLKDDTPL